MLIFKVQSQFWSRVYFGIAKSNSFYIYISIRAMYHSPRYITYEKIEFRVVFRLDKGYLSSIYIFQKIRFKLRSTTVSRIQQNLSKFLLWKLRNETILYLVIGPEIFWHSHVSSRIFFLQNDKLFSQSSACINDVCDILHIKKNCQHKQRHRFCKLFTIIIIIIYYL